MRSQIFPVGAHYKQQHSVFIPKFSLKLRTNLCRGRVGMMKHSKSFNSVAASVQPLEASALGRSENTLPSKGIISSSLNFYCVLYVTIG